MFESDFDVLVLFPKLKDDKSRDDLVLNRREFVFLTCAAAHLSREENKEVERMSAAIEKEANSRKWKQDAADKKEKAEKKRKSKALLISTAAEKKNCDVVPEGQRSQLMLKIKIPLKKNWKIKNSSYFQFHIYHVGLFIFMELSFVSKVCLFLCKLSD